MDEDFILNFRIPYFNKITYAPLGVQNFENTNETEMNASITNIIRTYNKTHPNNLLRGNELIKKLNTLDKDKPENLKSKFKQTQSNKAYLQAYLLERNKDQLYQSVELGVPIIEKSFSPDKDESRKHWDIYVVGIENADPNTLNTAIHVGDRIFNDPDPDVKEGFTSSINVNIGEDDETTPITSVTTSDLIDLMYFYDFKNVVVIDYSCEFCCPPEGCSFIPRNRVMELRDLKKRGEIGGKKTIKRGKPAHV